MNHTSLRLPLNLTDTIYILLLKAAWSEQGRAKQRLAKTKTFINR